MEEVCVKSNRHRVPADRSRLPAISPTMAMDSHGRTRGDEMKADYIVLRVKQPNTRDLFTGGAADWANAYLAARALPLGGGLSSHIGSYRSVVGGAGAMPGIDPMALPAFRACSTAILATTGPIIPRTVPGTRKSIETRATVRNQLGTPCSGM